MFNVACAGGRRNRDFWWENMKGLFKHRLGDNIKVCLISIKEDRALDSSASGEK